jgi:regulator of sigma E protease
MLYSLHTILAYIVTLGALVFFHELGHYLAARSQGVVVEAFSVGFGPALLSWRSKKTGTVWKISVLPLGGYVKMQGWGETNVSAPALPGSFSGAKLRSKALIVAAGPVANLVLAFVLFCLLFVAVGRPVVAPVFNAILPDSPAAAAGLQVGDRVLRLDGTPIANFMQLQNIILAHPDSTVNLTLLRHGQQLTLPVKLGEMGQGGEKAGRLGVAGDETSMQRFSIVGAVSAAGLETWNDAGSVVTGIYRLVVYRQGLQNLAGPLGIAQITGKVAAMGVVSLINLIALLSINLGLVNLIPIPILDGGHLLFYAAEAVFRRPIPARAQDVGLRIGIAIILSLFFVTTFNDLTRMGAVHWVAHLFG